jgi:hypothetical protein
VSFYFFGVSSFSQRLSSTGIDAMTTPETVIVGAGQAGLTVSYFLQQNNCRFAHGEGGFAESAARRV